MYNLVACKVCYHVLVVTFPMPHDRGCEIKIIVIVIVIVIVEFILVMRCRVMEGIIGWLIGKMSLHSYVS